MFLRIKESQSKHSCGLVGIGGQTSSLLSSLFNRPFDMGVATAIGLATLTLLFQLIPDFGELFQWQREGSLFGYLTGHLTHWSWNHLIWDLTTFIALSYTALRFMPERFLLCLLIAGFVIPLEIALNQPQFETYRGLSGIDSALLGLTLVGLWKSQNKARGIALITLVAFTCKTIYELTTGDSLFVEQAEQNFIPAISAHLSGFLTGLMSGLIPCLKKASRPDLSPRLISSPRPLSRESGCSRWSDR